jgi:hypothetical protein
VTGGQLWSSRPYACARARGIRFSCRSVEEGRAPLTHVAPIGLTGEPADPGNSRWKMQRECEASESASALLRIWSNDEFSGCRDERG